MYSSANRNLGNTITFNIQNCKHYAQCSVSYFSHRRLDWNKYIDSNTTSTLTAPLKIEAMIYHWIEEGKGQTCYAYNGWRLVTECILR